MRQDDEGLWVEGIEGLEIQQHVLEIDTSCSLPNRSLRGLDSIGSCNIELEVAVKAHVITSLCTV